MVAPGGGGVFVELRAVFLTHKFFNLRTDFSNREFCNDSLRDKDWKTECDNLIREIIEENEGKFETATRYTHIIDLHWKWNRQ